MFLALKYFASEVKAMWYSWNNYEKFGTIGHDHHSIIILSFLFEEYISSDWLIIINDSLFNF